MIKDDIEDALYGGTIKQTLKSIRTLYAIVWIEIAVLAFIIVMMAWTLLYAMDALKEIADDNARVVEIITEGGRV